MAESAGEIYFVVDAKTDQLVNASKSADAQLTKLQTGMDKTDKSAARMQKSANDAAGGLGNLGKSAAESGAAVGRFVGVLAGAVTSGLFATWIKGSLDAAAQLDTLSRTANSSTDEFQRFAAGARTVGISNEKLSDILKDVNDKVGDFLSTGGGELADFFKGIAPQVGVTADQFRNLSGPQSLQLFVSTLEQAGVSSKEMTFYLEAIANDASILAPLLRDNGAAMNAWGDAAERLGLILSQDAIQGAKNFTNQVSTLHTVTGNLGTRIGVEMLPALQELTGLMIEVANDSTTAAAASEFFGTVLKGVATAAIGVTATLSGVGGVIGGVAAAAAAAASGDFTAAANIISSVIEDAESKVTQAGDRISKLWSGQYAQAGQQAAAVNTTVAQTTDRATISAKAYEDQLAASAKTRQEAERAFESESKKRADGEKRAEEALARLEQGLMATVNPTRELAQAQAQLALGEYATAAQIARVRELAGAAYDAKTAASNLKLLGQVDPIAGEQQRFQTELENLRKLNEAKLLEDQRYIDLKTQAETAHAEQMRVLQEENFRKQSEWNGLLLDSLGQLQQGATNALVGLVTGANNGEDAIRGLAASILNEAVGALVKLGIEQVKNMVIGQTAATAAAATAAGTGAAMASSYAPAAAAASIASFGGAAAAGLTALASAVPAALGLFGGGRQYGGPVAPGTMYRINESGPEVFQGAGGKQYMIPDTRGNVVSNADASGGGGGTQVIVNIVENQQRAGQVDQRQNADGQTEVTAFVADIMGGGPRSQAMEQAYGLRRSGR